MTWKGKARHADLEENNLVEGTESNRVIEPSRRDDTGVSWELIEDIRMVKGEQELEGQMTRSVVGKGK